MPATPSTPPSSTTPSPTSPSAASLTCLRIGAVLLAALTVVQPVLWLLAETGTADLMGAHRIVGQASLLVAVFAAVSAVLWARAGGNRGLMFHAIGMAVLALAQVALGEMGVRTVHMTLGVLILAGAVALATLAYRKPVAVVETTTA